MTPDVIRTLSTGGAAAYDSQQLHGASAAIPPIRFFDVSEAEDVETTIELEFDDREEWPAESERTGVR